MVTSELLAHHRIPVESWGKGSAKTLSHLLREIEEGETVLKEESGGLFRETSILYLTVGCFPVPGFHLPVFLKEDRQVFQDGRERRRVHPHFSSLGEKLKAGEEPTELTIARTLEEELGVKEFRVARRDPPVIREEESPSYPGLQARFTEYHYEVRIPLREYRPEGYVEVQEDKTTYFIWEEDDAG